MTNVDVDTGGADALQHGALTQIAPAHTVTHLGERDRDRAHARTTHSNDVQPLRLGEI
jgi:hypothetical protein